MGKIKIGNYIHNNTYQSGFRERGIEYKSGKK